MMIVETPPQPYSCRGSAIMVAVVAAFAAGTLLGGSFHPPPAETSAGFDDGTQPALMAWARGSIDHLVEPRTNWVKGSWYPFANVSQAWVAIQAGRGSTTVRAAAGENAYRSVYPDRERSVSTRTLGEVSSTTKLITAVCALKLWEQGGFDLDEPLHNYLPELEGVEWRIIRPVEDHPKFLSSSDEYTVDDPAVITKLVRVRGGDSPPEQYRYYTEPSSISPTARHLLSNTAGIFTSSPFVGIKALMQQLQEEAARSYTNASTATLLLAAFGIVAGSKRGLLAWKPGTVYAYSSYHAVPRLLEHAYKQVHGIPRRFDEVLADVVLEPFGMNDTLFFEPDAERRAAMDRRFVPQVVVDGSTLRGWALDRRMLQGVPQSRAAVAARSEYGQLFAGKPVDFVSAAGGLISCVEDVARVLQMLAHLGRAPGGPRFLRTSTVRLMVTAQSPAYDRVESRTVAPAVAPLFRSDTAWGLGFAVSTRPFSTHPAFVGDSKAFPYLEDLPASVAFWQGNAGMFWGLSLEDNLYVVSHSTAFVPIYLRDEILRAQPLAILYDHMK